MARSDDFKKLAHELCLQIAAMSPLYLTMEDIPEKFLDGEKKIYQEQLKDSGKPRKILDEIIEGKLKKYKEEVSNVFDLGCSKGIFLDMVAREGWVPYGSDVNHKLVEKNRKKYGEQVKLQSGIGTGWADRHFDVVTLFDTIEHLSEPISTLQECRRILKDDGLLVISTPNIGGIFPKVSYWLFGKTIGAWDHPEPPGHLYQFSKETLSRTLKKGGFRWLVCCDFEIYKAYTISELENSIVEALKRHMAGGNKDNGGGWNNFNSRERNELKKNGSLGIQKMPRLLVRFLSWSIVNAFYPVARITKNGDSMIVVAEKNLDPD